MILSRIKIDGSRLLAETGIDLTDEGQLSNLKGIKLNGRIVIDFRGYDECGPGPVEVSEIPSATKCRLLIISDRYSRLDANCSGDSTEDSPYIPYRGIAGIMRAAIFRGNSDDPFSIATDIDYSVYGDFANNTNLKQQGTFGYPWSDNTEYPGPINSNQYSSSDEPPVNMAKLLYPSTYAGSYDAPSDWTGPEMLAISNYYSGRDVDADLFVLQDSDSGGGYIGTVEQPPSSYSPEDGHTPILFDQDHFVAGSFGIQAWGTEPDNSSGSYNDSLRIVTYDDAQLWYSAGAGFANRHNSSGTPLAGIAFIGCTREQIGSFLQGASDTYFDVEALLSTNKIKSTGFIDIQNYELAQFNSGFQNLLTSVLGVPSGDHPNTWEFGGLWSSEGDFAIVTGIGPGSNSKFINQLQPFITNTSTEYSEWTFAQQLWHTIANTEGCYGWLVSGYPSLFGYSYMGFNGEYNLLGPISPELDPFDKDNASIQSSASDWPTRLHEVFVDPTELFNYMSDPDGSNLFQVNKGVLFNAVGITMDANAELDSLDLSSNGSLSSIIGSEVFETDYQVLFSKRVLDFTVNINNIG